MIKFSTSSTAWQQIWQVITKAENKQNNTVFSIKEMGKKPKFEMTENFSFNFSGTNSWITSG